MCYADGELDDTRLDEIARVLAHDAMAQAKLDAMSMVGDLLRELADGDARGDGIDAFVMQQIANEAAHVPVLEPVSPPGQAPLVPLPAVPQNHSAGASSHPSNDNWRGIFTLATVAAAVAAGFFLWSRTEPSGPTAVATSNIPMVSVPAGDPPQSDPAYSAAPDLKAAPFGVDAVAGIGVEVAAVDFGSLSGSVFYVPGDAAASDTTVLWVTDEGDAP